MLWYDEFDMFDRALTTRPKAIFYSLFLLKSVVVQVLRFDYDLAHLTSTIKQFMPHITISPLAIVPLHILG